jgi:hypothetical protein
VGSRVVRNVAYLRSSTHRAHSTTTRDKDTMTWVETLPPVAIMVGLMFVSRYGLGGLYYVTGEVCALYSPIISNFIIGLKFSHHILYSIF